MDLGIDFIDAADSDGPFVSEDLIRPGARSVKRRQSSRRNPGPAGAMSYRERPKLKTRAGIRTRGA